MSPLHPKLKLRDVLRSNVCAKASVENISEYLPLWSAMHEAEQLGWPPRRKVAHMLLMRGVRGEEGVRLSHQKVIEKNWDLGDQASVLSFATEMLSTYEAHIVDCGVSQREVVSVARGGATQRPIWRVVLANATSGRANGHSVG